MKISNRNLMQVCTKIRINSSKNRYLMQICTKIRINICTIQKKAVPLQAIYERCSEKIYVHSIFGVSDGSAAGDGG